jgi:hypothetical protein
MSTRTIVTSQPDVACELCSRRLLRGETHEVFIADGRPRNVCELCAPRAADAGWIRERDGERALTALSPPRRGRGIFERLRLGSRGGEQAHAASADAETLNGEQDPTPPAWVERTPTTGELRGDELTATSAAAGVLDGYGTGESLPERLTHAAAVFNESEFPRRIAALARSLGAPAVCMRPAEHLDSAVLITVAWELCWYRYEVDLSDQPPAVRALAQGTELGELPLEERSPNAHASPSGTLSIS